jgi:hypothetical protein
VWSRSLRKVPSALGGRPSNSDMSWRDINHSRSAMGRSAMPARRMDTSGTRLLCRGGQLASAACPDWGHRVLGRRLRESALEPGRAASGHEKRPPRRMLYPGQEGSLLTGLLAGERANLLLTCPRTQLWACAFSPCVAAGGRSAPCPAGLLEEPAAAMNRGRGPSCDTKTMTETNYSGRGARSVSRARVRPACRTGTPCRPWRGTSSCCRRRRDGPRCPGRRSRRSGRPAATCPARNAGLATVACSRRSAIARTI